MCVFQAVEPVSLLFTILAMADIYLFRRNILLIASRDISATATLCRISCGYSAEYVVDSFLHTCNLHAISCLHMYSSSSDSKGSELMLQTLYPPPPPPLPHACDHKIYRNAKQLDETPIVKAAAQAEELKFEGDDDIIKTPLDSTQL